MIAHANLIEGQYSKLAAQSCACCVANRFICNVYQSTFFIDRDLGGLCSCYYIANQVCKLRRPGKPRLSQAGRSRSRGERGGGRGRARATAST